MTGGELVLHQVRYEQKSFWRNPFAAVFTVAFPLLFLLVFAGMSGHVSEYGGIHQSQYVVPEMISYGLMNATLTNPAISLVFRRESGLLKRMRLAPVPRWGALSGIVGNAFLTALMIIAVLLVLGFAAYDVPWYGHVLALAVTLVVGIVTFTALGVAVSTFVPNEDAGAPIVNFVYLGLLFLSGNFIAIRPGSTLGRIGDVFPVRHLDTAVITAFLPFGPHGPTHGFAWSDLGIIAAWGVGALVVSLRRWTWEPRRKQ